MLRVCECVEDAVQASAVTRGTRNWSMLFAETMELLMQSSELLTTPGRHARESHFTGLHSAPPRDAHVCGHTLEFLAASVVVTRLSSVAAQMERSDSCMLIADTSFLQKTKAHTRSPCAVCGVRCAVFMKHVQPMCVSRVAQWQVETSDGVAETSACGLEATCGKPHTKGNCLRIRANRSLRMKPKIILKWTSKHACKLNYRVCILLRVILTVNNNTFCFATIDKVFY
jgi:hypothetical protein